MFKSFRFSQSIRRTMLGIDITSTSVKLLELSQIDGRYRVEHYASVLLPNDIMDGVLVRDIRGLATCIRQLVTKKNSFSRRFLSKQAILAVPDSCTISKTIQVSPRLSERDIEELVLIEVDKYIPYPLEDIHFDFKLLGASVSNPAMRDLLIVASRALHVSHRVLALKHAGIRVKIVDIESSALLRVMQWIAPKLGGLDDKTTAILDIGAVFTNIVILNGTDIVFSCEEVFGGKQLKNVEDEKANTLFREQILLHVNRAFQFFYSSLHGRKVASIVLAGGVAKQHQLAEFLQVAFGIPIMVVNPFEQMSFAKTADHDAILNDAPLLMTACGLALRAF